VTFFSDTPCQRILGNVPVQLITKDSSPTANGQASSAKFFLINIYLTLHSLPIQGALDETYAGMNSDNPSANQQLSSAP
jgi:hypothetical protein